MPTVLLIAPIYPPETPVGFQRVVKFEKYLPEFGYKTCVLATQMHGHLPTDEVKSVYRAFEPGQIYRPFVRHLLKQPGRRPLQLPETDPYARRQKGLFEGTHLSKTRDWIVDNLAIPDMFIPWLPDAIRLGLRTIQKERVDIILSTFLPATAHLVGLALSVMARKPWIADFRDGWLFEPLSPGLYRKPLRRWIEPRLEALVANHADAIVTVSEPISEYFRTTYPNARAKCYTITNGYDPDDWVGVDPAPRDPTKFRIIHTGSFSISRGSQNPMPFFQAYKIIADQFKDQVELYLVGDLTPQEKGKLQELDLDHRVYLTGPVSKPESLAYQLSADLLLLFVGRDKSVATTKLYEYLYAKRPILAVSPADTAAAEIVRQGEAGWVVDPENTFELAGCLADLIRLKQNNPDRSIPSKTNQIERYHRRYLTRELARLMNSLLERYGFSRAA